MRYALYATRAPKGLNYQRVHARRTLVEPQRSEHGLYHDTFVPPQGPPFS